MPARKASRISCSPREGATTSAASRAMPPCAASSWNTQPSSTPGISSRRRVRSPSEARLPAISSRSAWRPRSTKRPSPSTSTRSASSTGAGKCAARTSVASSNADTRTPGSGVHAASHALRRRAMTQVSVEPNSSRTSQPKRASAAAASSDGSGAVAETMPASGGSSTPEFASARRCTGVVTSNRVDVASASARATSAGKNGRASCTAAPPSSGNSTESSMPYMCCGGTVATICACASAGHRSRSAARFCALLVANAPQVLGLACGTPVLPEVKPIAASASAATSGIASIVAVAPAISAATAASSSTWLERCRRRTSATTSGAREGGSSVALPRNAAAQKPMRKRWRSSHRLTTKSPASSRAASAPTSPRKADSGVAPFGPNASVRASGPAAIGIGATSVAGSGKAADIGENVASGAR